MSKIFFHDQEIRPRNRISKTVIEICGAGNSKIIIKSLFFGFLLEVRLSTTDFNSSFSPHKNRQAAFVNFPYVFSFYAC
jgi:hypothetical protein